ncbi:PQQ-dependent sugar dehydrogenase [Rhodobacteraceae bacterium 10Alg 79]|uniref:PQQ-dependent sugar dehydrogenase n=2 Tax=Rhodalgimonas zhirmunskyi TaxID=2964767 RepID=A0AAJ1U4E2_9RHOB|nr:PQQ-dependent sugar dehydrogenase [Rhodoalgimonas zhirmunskyi]MDQ2092774.1 PQQ-dependent sugar dehydrogenase [Rhodoalgimonas zhirmunskyi]
MLSLPLARPALAQSTPLRIEQVADGFRVPWSVGFLPGGDMLVTERAGRLWRVAPDGKRQRITGVPEVAARGQGGLLDVVVARDFSRTGAIFLSYAKAQASGGAGTALAVARLDGTKLVNPRRIFEMMPGSSGGRHFGGRIVEARDGTLFLTIGERGDRPSAQDLTRENGSVIRVARDGRIPPDNPFLNSPGTRPAIWSYGHRNPQGAALDGQGRLWLCEHGAQGGDEVNLIEKGANYGWPVISYGRHYSGAKIGEGTSKAGMKQPAFYWDPSIAPSGLAILGQGRFPGWQGAMLVGSLKFDHIAVLAPGAKRQITRIETPETIRVRDVREGPDGAIWFLSEGNGALYRITSG